MRFFDLALELLAIVLDFHINLNSRFENASRSCARFKVAVQVLGHAIAKQRTGNGTRFKETEMEQVAVVGQCEGGGIRVASILGRT